MDENKIDVGLWSKVLVFLCHKCSDKNFFVKCPREHLPGETLNKILKYEELLCLWDKELVIYCTTVLQLRTVW